MRAIARIKSGTAILPTRDIDTDQIIAARFLTTTSREGLGDKLFYDLRFHADGSKNVSFPLNQAAAKGCEILVAGNNFGCGSSREHAAWALLDYGFRAIVSTEFADIFRSNSLKNGLIPVLVDADTHQYMLQNPGEDVEVDVANATLTLADGRRFGFPIDQFARYCLVEGIDQLQYLQRHAAQIAAFEENRSWTP